jgi:hypothetical protein
MLRCFSVMLRALTEFGLTTAPESRVSVKLEPIEDLDVFLARKW